MTDSAGSPLDDIRMDTANLYREEIFTDLTVGTLRRLSPVTIDGTPDPDRPVLFSAETQLMSQAGPLPVNTRIEAESLAEAAERFPAAIKAALDRMMEEAREMQRRESQRIVTAGPGAIPPARPGGGGSGLIY